ncbi:uncharacterized protein ZHAS_00012585 [Anopheles sinensis]|uniref:Uncharacterized protein n=1 Tax=Anopheles sinensis TaxID=74873 RepID=A0A084W385_ANOSI|nr:uncharacterized protein ZHAS_00012585 [Anopheles sinensis]
MLHRKVACTIAHCSGGLVGGDDYTALMTRLCEMGTIARVKSRSGYARAFEVGPGSVRAIDA